MGSQRRPDRQSHCGGGVGQLCWRQAAAIWMVWLLERLIPALEPVTTVKHRFHFLRLRAEIADIFLGQGD